MKKTLEFKSLAPLSIGLDIGGTLTKISVLISKNIKKSNFDTEYDFKESIQLSEFCLYMKLVQTDLFKTEGLTFLKSKKE